MTFPPRRTRQVMLDASACSFSKADSLPYSESVETKVAKKTATAIPAVSNQSALRKRNKMLMARAASRIFMIGSPKLDKNCFPKLFRFRFVRLLEPCSRRERSTCPASSPRPPKGAASITNRCHPFSILYATFYCFVPPDRTPCFIHICESPMPAAKMNNPLQKGSEPERSGIICL